MGALAKQLSHEFIPGEGAGCGETKQPTNIAVLHPTSPITLRPMSAMGHSQTFEWSLPMSHSANSRHVCSRTVPDEGW